MITIFRKVCKPDLISVRKKFESGDWIDVLSPTEEEIHQLHKEYCIPKDFIHAALDPRERPRIDRENGWRLIIIRVPIIEEVSFSSIPMGIIVNKSKIITIYSRKNEIIRDFVDNRLHAFCTNKKMNLLLQFIKNVHRYYDQYVERINDEINIAEKRLEISQKNEEILGLLELQKTLVYFNTGAAANGRVLEKLATGRWVQIESQEDRDLLEDIIIENKELVEALNIFSNILSNTMDAYTSIISNNLNMVMKFLTSFTIIIAIPNIIFSLYGMNVRLPFQQFSWAVYFTVFISAIIMLVLSYYFNRKKFF